MSYNYSFSFQRTRTRNMGVGLLFLLFQLLVLPNRALSIKTHLLHSMVCEACKTNKTELPDALD